MASTRTGSQTRDIPYGQHATTVGSDRLLFFLRVSFGIVALLLSLSTAGNRLFK